MVFPPRSSPHHPDLCPTLLSMRRSEGYYHEAGDCDRRRLRVWRRRAAGAWLVSQSLLRSAWQPAADCHGLLTWKRLVPACKQQAILHRTAGAFCRTAANAALPLPSCLPALVQGAGVTNTIRSNIADLKYYTQKPDL